MDLGESLTDAVVKEKTMRRSIPSTTAGAAAEGHVFFTLFTFFFTQI
jgi:hypothetical protein